VDKKKYFKRFKMKKKIILSVVLACLALGLAYGQSVTAAQLNGTTWKGGNEEFRFSGSTFEAWINNKATMRGSFTARASGNSTNITLTVTEIYGDVLNGNSSGVAFQNRWYSQNQVSDVFRDWLRREYPSLSSSQLSTILNDLTGDLSEMFLRWNGTISGDTMMVDGERYTRVGGSTQTSNLNGTWQRSNDGWQFTISGNSGVITSFGTLSGSTQDAVNKGYLKVGAQFWRNLRSTGNLTWSGEELGVRYNTSSPNIATGTGWMNETFTLSADGRTLVDSTGLTYTRRQ